MTEFTDNPIGNDPSPPARRHGLAFVLGIGGALMRILGCGQETRERTDDPADPERGFRKRIAPR